MMTLKDMKSTTIQVVSKCEPIVKGFFFFFFFYVIFVHLFGRHFEGLFCDAHHDVL